MVAPYQILVISVISSRAIHKYYGSKTNIFSATSLNKREQLNKISAFYEMGTNREGVIATLLQT